MSFVNVHIQIRKGRKYKVSMLSESLDECRLFLEDTDVNTKELIINNVCIVSHETTVAMPK